MDLSGPWRAQVADDLLRRTFPDDNLDDDDWPEVEVPGHWADYPNFSGSDGPLLFRTRFTADSPHPDRRLFLELDGVAYQGDVWLDGSYLGPTEGYFVPHALEVTEEARRRSDHLLAVEVTCPPVGNPEEKRTLTGATQGEPDGWNPGGIWRPVRLRETGPVPLRHLRVVCTRATENVATLAIRAVVHTDRPRPVVFRTRVLGIDHRHGQPLAGGENRVEWSVRVPRPPLWWPAELGDQPLCELTLDVATVDGLVSDTAIRTVGFRSVRMRDHVWRVNGERLFLRGAIVPPLARGLVAVTNKGAEADLQRAAAAGLNLVRVAGHVSAPSLYEAADRAGMLLWQDMPLRGGYHRDVRGQAARQAREMVDLLGHHPSVVVWCGHDSPDPVDRTRAAPRLLDQQKPTWNRTVLDRTVRRALDQADPSRPVVSHSGVLPNLPRLDDADSHLWFGWYSGRRADLAAYLDRMPRAGRFVSAFGSQSVPEESPALSDGTLDPATWPDVDQERLSAVYGAEADVLLRRFPPADYEDPGSWAAATRRHQAELLRIQVEALRIRKYRPTGGFALDRLLDVAPAVSGSLLDHQRSPKPAYAQVAASCATTIVVADPPLSDIAPRSTLRFRVLVVHDGRAPLNHVRVDAVLTVAGKEESWSWGGPVEADSVTLVGTVEHPLGDATGPVDLALHLVRPADGVGADNGTESAGPGAVANHYSGRIGAG